MKFSLISLLLHGVTLWLLLSNQAHHEVPKKIFISRISLGYFKHTNKKVNHSNPPTNQGNFKSLFPPITYPDSSIERGEEGIVKIKIIRESSKRFRVTLLQSSGYASLDGVVQSAFENIDLESNKILSYEKYLEVEFKLQ